MQKFQLRLYIMGQSSKSRIAIENLKDLCKNELKDQYELTVIDVLERPQLAENEKIIATPTLIKDLPPPLKRVIGDLSNRDKVLLGLDIQPQNASTSEKNKNEGANQDEKA